MEIELSEEQAKAWREFREFAGTHIAPAADAVDADEAIPRDLVVRLASAGYFAAGFPARLGGQCADPVICGLMHEALGRASASVEGLVNVHHMATEALARWGTSAQKERWIPGLLRGEHLAAFAISEPQVGSDATSVETTAKLDGSEWILDGQKKWITCGQIADVFVLIARCEDKPTAFIVPSDAPGLSITPIRSILGCRGYMLAELALEGCRISDQNLIGKIGFGFSHVATTGLNVGRYNVAWTCVGVGQACLDASIQYARTRHQFDRPIKDFQLIQKMITRMASDLSAARALCLQAGYLRKRGSPDAITQSLISKYFASTTLNRIASDALQIHGANGCSSDFPVARYFRDAKIMEIIEGSTQILESLIARSIFSSVH